jgi:hypothetical protein
MSNGSSYITLGYNFLQLTINSIDEMEKQGNHHTIISDGNSSEQESWANYEEKTKWNDNNIAIPVLFNFYHGVELVLKGLYLICGSNELKHSHKLREHIKSLSLCSNPPDDILIAFFDDLLKYDPNGFFKENKSNSNQFHILFRYPEKFVKKDTQDVISSMLKSQKEVGLAAFKEIRQYAKGVKTHIQDWLIRCNNNKLA